MRACKKIFLLLETIRRDDRMVTSNTSGPGELFSATPLYNNGTFYVLGCF